MAVGSLMSDPKKRRYCDSAGTVDVPEWDGDGTTTRRVFDHVFEGWSVWLELDERDDATRTFAQHMEWTRQALGAENAGLYPFLPHLTLLYNFDPAGITVEGGATSSGTSCGDYAKAANKASELLQKTAEQYYQRRGSPDGETGKTSPTLLQAKPSSWYAFEYPKEADNGKGFDSAVSVLLFDKANGELQRLHRIARSIFPADERRGAFRPHLSLIYAPLLDFEFVKTYTNYLQQDAILLNRTLSVKSLSVWNTTGRIQDWHRVAEVPLFGVLQPVPPSDCDGLVKQTL